MNFDQLIAECQAAGRELSTGAHITVYFAYNPIDSHWACELTSFSKHRNGDICAHPIAEQFGPLPSDALLALHRELAVMMAAKAHSAS